MAQVIVNGNSIGGAGNPSKVWWWLSAICFAVFFLMLAIDDSPSEMEQYDECMDNAEDWFERDICNSTEFSMMKAWVMLH